MISRNNRKIQTFSFVSLSFVKYRIPPVISLSLSLCEEKNKSFGSLFLTRLFSSLRNADVRLESCGSF